VAANSYTLRNYAADLTAPIQSRFCVCEFNDAFTGRGAVAEGCHAAVFMDK
jgi:hypothetical protein